MKDIVDGRIIIGISLVVLLVGISIWAIAKAGSRLKGQLGTRDASAKSAGFLPPTLVKMALERGLVTPAQLAGMTPIERQFLLASLKDSLDEGQGPRR